MATGATPLPARTLVPGRQEHPLGVGCRPIGGPAYNRGRPMGWSTGGDERAAVQGLFKAYELGATVFDTADVYGLGESQRRLSRLVARVPRDALFLSSKVGLFQGCAPNAYTSQHLYHQVQQSLTNLRTDYLDLLALHNTDFGPEDRYLPEALEALEALKGTGQIRAVGLRVPHLQARRRDTGDHPERGVLHARMLHLLGQINPDVIAVRYNALSPDSPFGRGGDIFDFAARQDTAVMICKPLAQGLLTGKYPPDAPPIFGSGDFRNNRAWFSPPALSVFDAHLQPLRDHFGTSAQALARVALRYVLQRKPSAIVLTGFTSASQIEDNYSGLGPALSDDELALAEDTYARLRAALAQLEPVSQGEARV